MNAITSSGQGCPYPGIQPISEPGQLRGRQDLVDSVVDYLESSYPRLIEMHGPSGVGKSSLLQAGLVPELRSRGWRVLTISDWDRLLVDGGTQVDPYGTAVCRGMKTLQDAGGPGSEWVKGFNKRNYKAILRPPLDRTIVIFDQFEELLRANYPFAYGLLGRACELVSGTTDGYWHIVSFRHEVRHEIADLVERRLTTENWTDAPIDPVHELDIDVVVTEPLASSAEEPFAEATQAFVDVVRAKWQQLAESGSPTSSRLGDVIEPGLLHLQALLVVCWWLAVATSGGGVPRIHEGLVPVRLLNDKDPRSLFDWALKQYLEQRIINASMSATDNPRLRRALRSTAAGIVPHLWSKAGFKIFQDSEDLSSNSIPRLRDLLVPEDGVKEILTKAGRLDPTSAPVTRQRILDGLPQALVERGDSTVVAGDAAAEGLSPVEVVCELAATFEAALQLLKNEAIIRVTEGHHRRIVGLSHDALGAPLNDWSERELKNPWANIDSLVAVSGKQVLGNVLDRDEASVEADWRPTIAKSDYGPLDNVVWIGCQITAHFEDLVLSNCSFAGSEFNRSVFSNVTFENCDFRGAIFRNCEFTGAADTVINGSGTKLNALTFLWPPEQFAGHGLTFASGAKLRFNHVSGRGLFVQGASGGEIRIQDSTLEHVVFLAKDCVRKRRLGISIEDSEIRHLYVNENVRTPVRVSGRSRIRFADVGTVDVERRSLENVFGRGYEEVVSDGPGEPSA